MRSGIPDGGLPRVAKSWSILAPWTLIHRDRVRSRCLNQRGTDRILASRAKRMTGKREQCNMGWKMWLKSVSVVLGQLPNEIMEPFLRPQSSLQISKGRRTCPAEPTNGVQFMSSYRKWVDDRFLPSPKYKCRL